MPQIKPPASATPTVRGTTELILTVANPIAQVMAPQALNLIFSRFDVDAVCVPIWINEQQFDSFVTSALVAGNVRGMLVSIPHKTRLTKLLDRVDAAARLAGAANAVRRSGDAALEGALFDGSGFVGALRHHGVDLAGRRALLLGAGGAGLAIASALASFSDGPVQLAVFDTAVERASHLVEVLKTVPSVRTSAHVATSNDPSGFDLVINTTPLGLNANDPMPFDPLRLERSATVIDILMKSQPTPIERACLDRGIRAFSGHEMMVQQIPDYLDFFGYDTVAKELRQADHPAMRSVRSAMSGRGHAA
ncbi:shikimate dehydrogenase family protein [Hydrogenophaga sp.]|uniref:shikimate dehydrogenase family protein n=1 Tax=Hydrogenophaga sp. TaxID=1904254 RepID=UPI002FCA1AA3